MENEEFVRAIAEKAEYESEYDGRVGILCICCNGQDGEHEEDCLHLKAKKLLGV